MVNGVERIYLFCSNTKSINHLFIIYSKKHLRTLVIINNELTNTHVFPVYHEVNQIYMCVYTHRHCSTKAGVCTILSKY